MFFIVGVSFAQDSIHGKIYGDKQVAKYVKVTNILKNVFTYSDENGEFALKASIDDTIFFSSSFYENKRIVVDSLCFSETKVIQLKDKVNQLEEVVLKDNPNNKEFDTKTYEKELNTLIYNDIKNKPWEYKFSSLSGEGINLKGFKYLKEKLFKKKEQHNIETKKLEPITYIDLKNLNNSDIFFNDNFFTNELNIPIEFKYIFFEYFDEQKINSELLCDNKRLVLIEKFVEVSNSFLTTLNNKD